MLEIKEPVTPIIVDKKLEMIPVNSSLLLFNTGTLFKMLKIINKAINSLMRSSLIDKYNSPPIGTPITQPKEKGITIDHWTLNLKNTKRLKFDPNWIIACKGIIAEPGKNKAKTPSINKPPPKPIIDEIKEEIKLVTIITKYISQFRPSGKDKKDEIRSKFIKYIYSKLTLNR